MPRGLFCAPVCSSKSARVWRIQGDIWSRGKRMEGTQCFQLADWWVFVDPSRSHIFFAQDGFFLLQVDF
jgi:hypothetical protein